MTVSIRSAVKQVIFLLIVAGLILGLIYSAASDESYDAVRRLSGYQNEISTPVLHDLPDLIADSSANADQSRFLTEKGKTGRQFFAGPDDTGLADFRNCGILCADICMILLCVLSGTSFRHIFYIHLKDGNK